MTDSFSMYEGEDAEPYYPIEDSDGDPVDLSAVDEVVFVAADINGTVFLTLHLTDPSPSQITIDYDPDDTSHSTRNTIFVHLTSSDTDGLIGTFRHEVRVLLNGASTVVFPASVGEIETFSVVDSLTWNEITHLPRLMRVSSTLNKDPWGGNE